uniref:Acetyl-coenzyme A carboxylase carboxyl transferase subunit beta n=1 Tax=Thismia tentaculata TaxID=1841234 RepID=A0A1B0ZF37_9LILI|nr:acetyl-CoA carboxylase carboxyltransferase beta subunit [Thismia tentaculata]ANP26548.1 acetyl-CoA carboxylase carboxyltransferase beta subunit [Thismia tentaculata]
MFKNRKSYYHLLILIYDTRSSWNNCINNYLCFEISICTKSSDTNILIYLYFICMQIKSNNENGNSSMEVYINGSNFNLMEVCSNGSICSNGNSSMEVCSNGSNLTEKPNDFDIDDDDISTKYKHLWVQCENCFGLNYKKFFKSIYNICEQCGYHLKMNSSDRIDLSIDLNTFYPMDENMGSLDPIEFISEEEEEESESYVYRINSYQEETGLTEAVQTGMGKLDGIPVAIGVMDFNFIGGSMGSVVGEKITRLIEYATKRSLPLIIVCASGGARMQEGSFSLTQMAKISSALYNFQVKKKLLYIPVLTSPTTGGVTASFGMLGDIIITEPNTYIAFAGKRVIEQTLNIEVPDGIQEAEFLFEKGLLNLIVPRNLLKDALSELLQLFGLVYSFTLNQIRV